MAATGQLHPTDKVRREDWPSPRQASRIKGLFGPPAVPESRSTSPTPSTGSSPAKDRTKSAAGAPAATGKKIGLAVGVGVGALLMSCCVGLGVLGVVFKKPE